METERGDGWVLFAGADMQTDPWWSVALFTVDLLIIYGLVAHGGRAAT